MPSHPRDARAQVLVLLSTSLLLLGRRGPGQHKAAAASSPLRLAAEAEAEAKGLDFVLLCMFLWQVRAWHLWQAREPSSVASRACGPFALRETRLGASKLLRLCRASASEPAFAV